MFLRAGLLFQGLSWNSCLSRGPCAHCSVERLNRCWVNTLRRTASDALESVLKLFYMQSMRFLLTVAAFAVLPLETVYASPSKPSTLPHMQQQTPHTRRLGRPSTSAPVGSGESHNPLEFYRAANLRLADPSAAQLTVNETRLRHSGQWVEACWHGVGFPAADDYVALVVPSNATLKETAPAKYQWAALSPTHMQHGRGCLK